MVGLLLGEVVRTKKKHILTKDVVGLQVGDSKNDSLTMKTYLLTWRNPAGLPSTTRINSFLHQKFVFCTLIHLWRCGINCSYYSYVKKIEKRLIRDFVNQILKIYDGGKGSFNQFLFCHRNHREKS